MQFCYNVSVIDFKKSFHVEIYFLKIKLYKQRKNEINHENFSMTSNKLNKYVFLFLNETYILCKAWKAKFTSIDAYFYKNYVTIFLALLCLKLLFLNGFFK